MRPIITISGICVSIMLLIMIHCTIIGDNMRKNEVETSLNSSMDYAFDKMMDYYADKNFINYYEHDKNAITTDLMTQFCRSLQQTIKSDANLKVELLYLDLETGTFQVGVTEEYIYPLRVKKGKCYYEKTYGLY